MEIKMYGRILTGGGRFYTYLWPLFAAIGQRQEQYNWLITDFEGGFPLEECPADPPEPAGAVRLDRRRDPYAPGRAGECAVELGRFFRF